MKPNPWLYPALATIIAGGWIGFQRTSTARVEEKTEVLTQRIRQMRAAEDRASLSRTAEEKGKQTKDKKLDWKKTASAIAAMQNGGGQDMAFFIKLQRALSAMTTEELFAQLDEIEALDISKKDRFQLISMILGKLGEKEPQLVLERYTKEWSNEEQSLRWNLNNIFGQWAEKDPTVAIAWLDARIAAGTFDSKSLDGKNRNIPQIESFVMSALLDKDPAKAAARLAALPEDQRLEVFTSGYSRNGMKPENDAAYVNLARTTLSEKDASRAISERAQRLGGDGDFSRIDQYITAASATDSEKKAIVENVFSNQLGGQSSITDALDKARTWAASQTPESVDEATGKALARYGETKYADVALHYQETTGSDAVLVSYLTASHSSENKKLIEKIKDPVQREAVTNLRQYKNQ